jgi:hypothetical protein
LIGFWLPSDFDSTSWMPAELEHRAHAAAGDHAGTGRRRLQQHARGRVHADVLVRDRRPVHRHLEEVLAGALDALLDGDRDLVRLAVADADLRLLVAHHHEGGEREPPAALDHLGDAVDLDHALLEVRALPARSACSVPTGHENQSR